MLLSYNMCLVKKMEKRGGAAGLLKQHELLKNLPDASKFQDETLFHPIFQFASQYAVKLYGVTYICSYLKRNPGATIWDLFTTSDIAYCVSVMENKMKCWDQTKEMSETSNEEMRNMEKEGEYTPNKKPKFNPKEGRKLECLAHDWRKESIQFYEETRRMWRNQMRTAGWWDLLQKA